MAYNMGIITKLNKRANTITASSLMGTTTVKDVNAEEGDRAGTALKHRLAATAHIRHFRPELLSPEARRVNMLSAPYVHSYIHILENTVDA